MVEERRESRRRALPREINRTKGGALLTSPAGLGITASLMAFSVAPGRVHTSYAFSLMRFRSRRKEKAASSRIRREWRERTWVRNGSGLEVWWEQS